MKEEAKRAADYYVGHHQELVEFLERRRLPEPFTFTPWNPSEPERLTWSHLSDLEVFTSPPPSDSRIVSPDPSDYPFGGFDDDPKPLTFTTWDPRDPEQWDFEHGPRFDEWIGRTGKYEILFSNDDDDFTQIWYRAVPALAWANADTCASWLHHYLERIRLVVVDELGVRRPRRGDPLEEAVCLELAELIEPIAALAEEEDRTIHEIGESWDSFSGLEQKLVVWWQDGADYRWKFAKFLEARDLGDGRLAVAFGPGASFREDYDTLLQTFQRKGDVEGIPSDSWRQ
jgi:hypothetical protein